MTTPLFTIHSTQAQTFGSGDTAILGEVILLNTPNDGTIALTHLPAPSSPYPPLVFLHGMFSNRKFWLSDKGIGLAAHLNRQGYECWLIERRGMGASPKHSHQVSLEHCVNDDLPAIQAYIHQTNPNTAIWLAHSFGGVQISASLARQKLNAELISGLMFFSSQLTAGKYPLNPPLSWILSAWTKLTPTFPSRKLNMGPEDESAQVMRDCIRWVKQAKKNGKGDTHQPFWQGFEHITAPLLAFGSEGDTVDPHSGCAFLAEQTHSSDKQFILLGKAHGHKQDYTHAGMVTSKDAIQEVWPMVEHWLSEQSKKKG